jgi:hypothetical protein
VVDRPATVQHECRTRRRYSTAPVSPSIALRISGIGSGPILMNAS